MFVATLIGMVGSSTLATTSLPRLLPHDVGLHKHTYTDRLILTSLPRNQVPEWSTAYINYKGLKKIIKAASEKVRDGVQVDPAGGRHCPCP